MTWQSSASAPSRLRSLDIPENPGGKPIFLLAVQPEALLSCRRATMGGAPAMARRLSWQAQVQALQAEGVGPSEIARRLGIGRSSATHSVNSIC
jgi:hypothetical protein